MPREEGNDQKFVTVISKNGCHLCEKVIGTLEELLRQNFCFHLEVISIDDDPQLFQMYWIKVPVVQIDGVDLLNALDIATSEDYRIKLEKILAMR